MVAEMRRTSSMRSASMDSRPAVSTMSTSRPRRTASSRPFLATVTGSDGLAEHRHAGLLAEHPELLDRRRALQVGAHEQWVAALVRLYQEASFAAVVVLPDPWRPARSTTVGGRDA
jgi:hypothetical protein